ncbi:MAG: putative DNA-binding domain-containing protein, partial [Planctomycetaceae bacterium]
MRAAIGDEAFRGFVRGYLQQHPSTSYTLAELGHAFPAYLAASRPPCTGEGPDWADFLVDLATHERTYSEVFDGPGEEQLPLLCVEDLQAIPTDRWGDVRLRTAASLRLLELRFPVHEFASAVRHET